jgi:hypothetical protein
MFCSKLGSKDQEWIHAYFINLRDIWLHMYVDDDLIALKREEDFEWLVTDKE